MIEDDCPFESYQIITDYLKSFWHRCLQLQIALINGSMLDLNKGLWTVDFDLTLPEIDGLELIPKIEREIKHPYNY